MRLLFSVSMVMALAVSSHVTTFAAPKFQLSLTAVDAGVFTFTGPLSASLSGDGFEKQGFGLNQKVGSSGQFNLVPNKCAPDIDGFSGLLEGSFVEADGDTFSYTIANQLCPTQEPNVYSATGTYKITRGTGKYVGVKGVGSFEGLADFAEAKYKCLLSGQISY